MRCSVVLALLFVLACGSEDTGDGANAGGANAGASPSAGVSGAQPGGSAGTGSPAGGATIAAGGAGRGGSFAAGATSAGAGGTGTASGGTSGGRDAPSAGSGGASAAAGSSGASAGASLGGNASGGRGGSAGAGGALSAGAGAGGTSGACPGRITYTLARAASPTPQQTMAYDRITAAMDRAVQIYNCNTSIQKALNVSYNPDVQTADGNPNGSLRFGSMDSMNYITAMHEISHTVGIGGNEMDRMVMNGIFPGANATAQLREITGNPTDEVHADMQHFWPYGLNYTSEVKSDADLVNHCKMVVAIRKDLGL